MKRYKITYRRIEECECEIEAESKNEVKDKIGRCEWDLGEERINRIINKNFKIQEIK